VTMFTIGHSTRPLPEFIGLLKEAGADAVADVRAFPSSRTQPQFNGDALAAALKEENIIYRHFPALGGRRHRAKGAPPSANTLWENDSFRNYADYAETDAFRDGLAALIAFADTASPAIMCAEAVWWRCHRRIVADYLIARGIPVLHIMGPQKIEAARLTPGATLLPDGRLAYRGPQGELAV
jgi:uncharacterized protein (DUF488 family)